MMRPVVLILAGTLALAAASADAQSLADVARKTEAQRTDKVEPGKTYTNADLKPDPNGPSPSAAPAAAAATVAGTRSEAAAANGDVNPAADPPKSDEPAPEAAADKTKEQEAAELAAKERFWRGSAKSIRTRIDAAQRGIDQVSQAPTPNEKEKARVDALLQRFQNQLKSALYDMDMLRSRASIENVPAAWLSDLPQ